MIDRYEHFTYANNEINKFLRKIAGDEMKKHGLKSPHAIYFTVLSNNTETGLTATQLCELSGRDKADVSRMLALMEEKGLVVKKGTHQNLYNGYFTLTQQGLEIAECVKQRATKAVEIAGKDLTVESRQIFYNSLDSIVNNLKLLSMKGIPE
ncbi:MAG: MarR family transcriptional regulator [Clostridia bacterium]|nr:MarR family transcriptional regulator [Clostridia bacterium]